jgi:hypothetical protein
MAGAVQRIHLVVKADVLPWLLDRWPDSPATEDTTRPHAVTTLAHNFRPSVPIPSGVTYCASRLWVLLDQQRTALTLAEALAGSKSLVATC